MSKVLKYLAIIVGSALMGMGLGLFLIPAQIAPGGISGLATVFHYLIGLPTGLIVLIINIPIFIVGLLNFSKRYILISFFGMILLSVFIEIFSVFGQITNDVILASVFGGAFTGAGIGLVFRYGATTGGTDIIVMLLKKRFKGMSMGNFVVLVDAVIVIFAGIVFKTWETILYSTLAMIVSSYVIDAIVEGIDYAKAVFVISDKPEVISENISAQLFRGTTCLMGFSPYTLNEKNVLLCVVRRYEITKLKKIIYEADKQAFVVVSDAKEVLGKGFGDY